VIYEDTLNTPTPAELALHNEFTGLPALRRLAKVTLATVTTRGSQAARARAVFSIALQSSRNRTLVAALGADFAVGTFNSRVGLLVIDQALRPYYGNLRAALSEATSLGMTTPAADWVLNTFLRDEAVSRVQATCALLAWSSALVGKVEDPVVGSSSPLGAAYNRQYQLTLPAPSAPVASTMYAAVTFTAGTTFTATLPAAPGDE